MSSRQMHDINRDAPTTTPYATNTPTKHYSDTNAIRNMCLTMANGTLRGTKRPPPED